MSLDVWLEDVIPATTGEVFSANYTHNLNETATKAGIYGYIWTPNEIGITKAKQLIAPLTEGLLELKSKPDYYKQFDPENGWGDYDSFVEWVEKYLNACISYPNATVKTSR